MEKTVEMAMRNVELLQRVIEDCVSGGHQPDASTVNGLVESQRELHRAEKELFSQIEKNGTPSY